MAEWTALGEHARAKMPKNKQLFTLGALLEDATADETTRFMALLPTPAVQDLIERFIQTTGNQSIGPMELNYGVELVRLFN